MGRFEDLTGRVYGEWKAIQYDGSSYWVCKSIITGEEKRIHAYKLKNNKSTLNKENIYLKLNSHYNDWEIIEIIDSQHYRCRCSCGNVERIITKYDLVYGRTKSCGHKFNAEAYISSYEFESNGEIEVREYIRTIYNGDIFYNRKDILGNGQELGIYIPELKLAIEFNGNYWHSSLFKDKNYHQNKTICAVRKGIRLIHIFEYEWNDLKKQEKIKEMLRTIIDSQSRYVLYGVRLSVREISNSDAVEFCNKYHLQNGINSKVSIGLYYEDELVAVTTFGKQRYNKDNDRWEMYRLVFMNGVIIAGGAEKMFKYFVREYNPNEIISYCDISKFLGNVYTRLGFKTTTSDITQPSYVWQHTNKNITLSRYQTTKQKLIEKGLGDESQTEDEIMESNGFLKIYGCGNLKFTWRKAEG